MVFEQSWRTNIIYHLLLQMDASYFTQSAHSKPLIQEQQHPFQPNQHYSHPPNYSTLTYYQTIKKVIQTMSICDPQKTAPEDQYSIQQHNAHFASSPKSSHSRYETPHLQKYVQHEQVRPEQKLFNSQNQPLQLQQDLKEVQRKEELTFHEQEEMMRRNEVLVKGGFVPCKKENYFQTAGGFTEGYEEKAEKMINVLPNCRHPYIFVVNLFLVMTGCLSFIIRQNTVWIIFAGVAVIYFLVVYFSKIREDVFAIRKKEDLKEIVSRIKENNAYFLFSIECFHYDTKGKMKIVTLNKTEVYSPAKSIDESFDAQSLELESIIAEISIGKHFIFGDKDSQQHFIAAFNDFVSRNSKDVHQKYHYSFEIESSNQANGLFSIEQRFDLKILFVIFAFSGLFFLYSLIMQCKTTRFKAKFLKRLTFSY